MRIKERTEAQEQEALIEWCELNKGRHPELAKILHIPNGGYRTPAEAAHFKRLGVKAGVPDLLLPYPIDGWHGLWIELKSINRHRRKRSGSSGSGIKGTVRMSAEEPRWRSGASRCIWA